MKHGATFFAVISNAGCLITLVRTRHLKLVSFLPSVLSIWEMGMRKQELLQQVRDILFLKSQGLMFLLYSNSTCCMSKYVEVTLPNAIFVAVQFVETQKVVFLGCLLHQLSLSQTTVNI